MAVSPDNWDTHWFQLGDAVQALNPAMRFRERLVLRRLQIPNEPISITDLGCGMGDFVFLLSKAYPQATLIGIESSNEGINRARLQADERHIAATFLQRDLLTQPSPDDLEVPKAEFATCCEVLEHVDSPSELLLNSLPYLTSGCRLVVTVPGGPRSAYDHHIGHRRHFTRRRLRSDLIGAGLTVESIDAAGFPFFNIYKLLVMLRGTRTISDAALPPANLSLVNRVILHGFDLLFHLNLPIPVFGWQLVAVATVP